MTLKTNETPRPFERASLIVMDDEDYASSVAVFVIDHREVTVSLDRFFDGR